MKWIGLGNYENILYIMFLFQKIQTIWVCRWIYLLLFFNIPWFMPVLSLMLVSWITKFLSSPQKCYKNYKWERQRYLKFIISSMDLDLVSSCINSFRTTTEKGKTWISIFLYSSKPFQRHKIWQETK